MIICIGIIKSGSDLHSLDTSFLAGKPLTFLTTRSLMHRLLLKMMFLFLSSEGTIIRVYFKCM